MYHTGNPLGRSDPRDLFDNAQVIDRILNSGVHQLTDRLGRLRLTWNGVLNNARLDIEQAVEQATEEARSFRDEAREARDDAIAAASASGDFVFAKDLEDMQSKLPQPDEKVIEVAKDANHENARTRYVVFGGMPVFVVNLDHLRLDLKNESGASRVGFIQAKVGAVARTVSEKLQESVSVLDFGADKTGGIDSSDAFEAASLAGVSYVPEGVYKVGRYVRGQFVTNGDVSILGSTTHVKKIGADTRHLKDLLFAATTDLPLYEFVESKWGGSSVPSTQGLSADAEGNFYVVFSIDKKSINATDNKYLIAKFDNKFSYIGCAAFESLKYVEQVVVMDGAIYFAGESQAIYKYSVSDLSTWNNGDFSREYCERILIESPFDSDFQLSWNSGRWYNSTRSNINGYVDTAVPRHYIFEIDEALKVAGYIELDIVDAGWNGITANVNTPTRAANPKRQSFSVTDEHILCHMGGYWSDNSSELRGFSQQGLKVFSQNGSHVDTVLYNPRAFREVLADHGLDCYFLEAEGVFAKDGQVFTIYATGTKETGGHQFVIFREFSGSSGAWDFAAAVTSPRGTTRRLSENLAVFDGMPMNPISGELMESLPQVCKYLQDTSGLKVTFAVQTGGAFDLLPLKLLDGFYQITVESRRGSGFLIHFSGPTRNGCGTFWATLSPEGAEFLTINAQPVSISSLRLYGADVGGNRSRITHVNPVIGTEVVVQYLTDADRLDYGGNSSVFDAAIGHRFYASTIGQTGEKVGLSIFDADRTGVYASRNNAIPLGKAANQWTEVHARTGAINTSDAREKTEPVPISDAVLDAWGDVQIIVYQWLDAIRTKGKDLARWHFGVIAQHVRDAFSMRGLDATRYGLLCYDEWDAMQAEVNAEGVIVMPAREAGSRWGIRADQCLFLEAAYQRRENQRMNARLERLEQEAGLKPVF